MSKVIRELDKTAHQAAHEVLLAIVGSGQVPQLIDKASGVTRVDVQALADIERQLVDYYESRLPRAGLTS